MDFTNMNICLTTIVFYLQTIINDIVFTDVIIIDFNYSLYNILFSLSYCAIITKVCYKHCNIIWHFLTIVFMYCYKYLHLKKQNEQKLHIPGNVSKLRRKAEGEEEPKVARLCGRGEPFQGQPRAHVHPDSERMLFQDGATAPGADAHLQAC